MKTLRKTIAVLLGLVMLLEAGGPALAAQVKQLKVKLSETRPSLSSNHQWTWIHTSTATLRSITFKYCTHPSDAGDGCTPPAGYDPGDSTLGAVNGFNGSWTLNNTGEHPRLESTDANGQGYGANASMDLYINSITNNQISGSGCTIAASNSSATCYVRLYTYTSVDGTTGLTDTGIASYTIVAQTVVTARVDPTFTFVVSAVGANTAYGGATTSVASTFNELNFGNLTAGTPKYAAHMLNVITNTENGYNVYMKMETPMTGVYTNNNIDPFAAPGVTWSGPVDWLEPNGGTSNDNTGWIGANTTDQDVWSGNRWGKFGPVNSDTTNTVMNGARSDNGTTGIYVTYAIEANVFQPADTYTGTIVYNALPTY